MHARSSVISSTRASSDCTRTASSACPTTSTPSDRARSIRRPSRSSSTTARCSCSTPTAASDRSRAQPSSTRQVRAHRQGLTLVALRKAGHLGRIGAYAEELARRGLVAIAFCSVPTRFHNVAWFGTREGRLGTNPIAYAYPTGGVPVVADFSTSAIPEGDASGPAQSGLAHARGRAARRAGRSDGRPQRALRLPTGNVATARRRPARPQGQRARHARRSHGHAARRRTRHDPRRDNTLAVVAFTPPTGFDTRAAASSTTCARPRPSSPARPPLVPGEPEARTGAATERVLVDPTTWAAIGERRRDRWCRSAIMPPASSAAPFASSSLALSNSARSAAASRAASVPSVHILKPMSAKWRACAPPLVCRPGMMPCRSHARRTVSTASACSLGTHRAEAATHAHR